jgi:hypothetical protein
MFRLRHLRRFATRATDSPANSEHVPRITILLGGGGLIPFVWYGSQIESTSQNRGGASTPNPPSGDELINRWARHTPSFASPVLEFLKSGDQHAVRVAFVTYSASILSFLAGVQWGAAAMTPASVPGFTRQVLWSVTPSLFGWGAAASALKGSSSASGAGGILGPAASDARFAASTQILAASFLAAYLADEMGAQSKRLPKWYSFVRTPLTLVVVGTHIFVGMKLREAR